MKPTRRVMLAIGVLVLVMVTGLFVSWHVQTRALGAALVRDVESTLATTLERNSGPGAPKHENGYACFAQAVDAMPADVSPFDQKSAPALAQMLDAGVVFEVWQAKVASLEPWAASVRSCGDSARLQFVPGVTPFAPFAEPLAEAGNQAVNVLSRLARLQARTAGEEPEVIAARCVATLEVALDRSRVHLIGAMIAAAAVRQLTPSCGEALQHLGGEARPLFGARLERLRSRLVTNHELLDHERVLMALELFSWTLTPEERAKLPPGGNMMRETLANPVLRFALARSWGRWDSAMRQLAASADAPGPARIAASGRLDEAFNAWWMPGELSVGGPGYDRLLVRNDETAILLQLLADLAAGGERSLPPQVTREAEGLVFTNFEGVRLIIPQR